MTKLLIQNGAIINANASLNTELTCLEVAVRAGKPELVLFLVSKGADINQPASRVRGRTSLQAAVELSKRDDQFDEPCLIGGKHTFLQTLIDAGADVNASPSPEEGMTAFTAAVEVHNVGLTAFCWREELTQTTAGALLPLSVLQLRTIP